MKTPLRRQYILYLVLLAGFVIFFDLGGREPETKDYIKHAEVAREIRELGDWTLLHLGGRIYVDKPPLHFWFMAGVFRLLGVGPAAARMPEAVAAFVSVLLVFFAGEQLFSSTKTGFLAGLFLLSSYAFYIYARRMRLDIEFSLFFALALFCFYFGLSAPGRKAKALWYTALWLSVGAAGMIKGFVALGILAVILPYAVGLFGRENRRAADPALLAATCPFLLVPVLPWAIRLMAHPRFEDYLQVFSRVTIMTRHEDFYYYALKFPAEFMPVTPLLGLGVWTAFRRWRVLEGRRGLGFLLWWFGSFLLILHFTSVKNLRYTLPVFLPAALISAWAASYHESGSGLLPAILAKADRLVFYFAALSFAAPVAVAVYYKETVTSPLLMALAAGGAFCFARRYLPTRTAGVFVSMLFIFLNIELADGVRDDRTGPYRALCETLRAEGLGPGQVGFLGCDARARYFAGFFYDRLSPCSDHVEDLLSDPGVQAIVMERDALKRSAERWGATLPGRVLTFPKGVTLLFKSDELRGGE